MPRKLMTPFAGFFYDFSGKFTTKKQKQPFKPLMFAFSLVWD